jgi:hypothetical protein
MNLNIINNIDPVKKYDNAEALKIIIFSENRNKSGIYR